MRFVNNIGVRELAVWCLSGLLAAVFITSGIAKLAQIEPMVESFMRWGYPMWFMLLIGALELVNGALLLTRRFAFHAAWALGVIMFGAVTTHLVHAEWLAAIAPMVLVTALAVLAHKWAPADLPRSWHVFTRGRRPHSLHAC